MSILKYEIKDINRAIEWGEKHFIEHKPELFIDSYIEAGRVDKAISEYEEIIKKYGNDKREGYQNTVKNAEKRLKFIKNRGKAIVH
jgi:hypothetical protein